MEGGNGGPDPDRWGTVRAARRGMVRTGETPGSLTCGPRPVVGEREREERHRTHRPARKRKRRGPSLKE
jgi:hypothetical protein